ncbi:hypothetical protein E4U55_005613 [Claviceps digitariae]|nr:hypothetical protein E4U55_005613 [Claviceps digitariae]
MELTSGMTVEAADALMVGAKWEGTCTLNAESELRAEAKLNVGCEADGMRFEVEGMRFEARDVTATEARPELAVILKVKSKFEAEAELAAGLEADDATLEPASALEANVGMESDSWMET